MGAGDKKRKVGTLTLGRAEVTFIQWVVERRCAQKAEEAGESDELSASRGDVPGKACTASEQVERHMCL